MNKRQWTIPASEYVDHYAEYTLTGLANDNIINSDYGFDISGKAFKKAKQMHSKNKTPEEIASKIFSIDNKNFSLEKINQIKDMSSPSELRKSMADVERVTKHSPKVRFRNADKAYSMPRKLSYVGEAVSNNKEPNYFKMKREKKISDMYDDTISQVKEKVAKETKEKVAKETKDSLWDIAKKNKIPQIALGVGVTAWLVNKLSDSRGQQSNSQLYNPGGYY